MLCILQQFDIISNCNIRDYLLKVVCSFYFPWVLYSSRYLHSSEYFFGAATEVFLSIYIISIFGINRKGNSNSMISTYFALPPTERCSVNFLQFLEHQQKIFQCSSSVKPCKRNMMKYLCFFFPLENCWHSKISAWFY